MVGIGLLEHIEKLRSGKVNPLALAVGTPCRRPIAAAG